MINEKIKSAFITILGDEHVIDESSYLQSAATTNYRTTQKIALVLKPGTVDELQQCVQLANSHKIPVYPISRGRNWGYGSRVPVKDNNILIELERLNKISDYNEKLGYVTVEPGVTYQQLYDFLRERKSELLISATGGSTGSSVLGNAIERGIGTGLYADRFASVCGLEVMLADGKRVSTGFGRFGNHMSSHVYRWGSGPSLDGMFSQSNFGIVTKLTQWLMKAPDYFHLLAYKIDSEAKLPALIDKLRDLSMSGLVRPTITMYNDFRVLSTVTQYPFNVCTPGKTHPEEVLQVLKSVPQLAQLASKWNGEISIRSVSKEHGLMQYSLIEKELKPLVDQLYLVEIAKDEMLETLQEHYEGKTGDKVNDPLRAYLLRKYIGIPENTPIKQMYWRKRKPAGEGITPDADKCGMVWISPIVPFDGNEIEKAISIINNTICKYPFEPAISLQCMTERAINIIISINWDREVEGEDTDAEACYADLSAQLKANGYYPYRDTTLGMQMKEQAGLTGDYQQLLSDIKKAIDPNNIISPGRYNII
jgi:4-cresol dehydrogenase (hydroxylating)